MVLIFKFDILVAHMRILHLLYFVYFVLDMETTDQIVESFREAFNTISSTNIHSLELCFRPLSNVHVAQVLSGQPTRRREHTVHVSLGAPDEEQVVVIANLDVGDAAAESMLECTVYYVMTNLENKTGEKIVSESCTF